jgi:hypothetical protein
VPDDCVVFIYHQSVPNRWHFSTALLRLSEPGKKQKISALVVALAFVPSVLLLAFFTGLGSSNPPAALFIAFCGISIVSCFASAILLFRRRTALAVFLAFCSCC